MASAVSNANALPNEPSLGRELDSVEIARRHRMVNDVPTPNFFEGMLMGNGDLGLCVTLRPDALGLHIGKEDVWDIRVSEDHYQHVLPFQELLKLWERAGEEAKRQGKPEMTSLEYNIDFFREYTQKVGASYAKPWPRPWPCGIVWVHWDPRQVTLVRQSLDIATGLYTAEMQHDDLRGKKRPFRLFCVVNYDANHVCLWSDWVQSEGPAPIRAVTYDVHTQHDSRLPAPEGMDEEMGGRGEIRSFQRFPATAPTEAVPDPPPSSDDSSFALDLAYSLGAFRIDLALATPRDLAQSAIASSIKDPRQFANAVLKRFQAKPVEAVASASARGWAGFWSKSAVDFQDRELERIWYHNQYFLACCLREGKVAPGLFGNWSSGRIGTAWHGDYHMNYNTQQVWWGVFSSNHAEQHLPYVDLCEKLTVLGEAYAKEKFGLPGAFFFHSAYPVPSKVNPYPVPPWGYEVCETPWTVQSLWWHYLYTQDREYLERAYPMLRAACRFLAAYVKQGGDGRFHIIPTVSPENWGFTVDMRLNKDCIIDLALSQFVLKATAEAARILGVDADESARWHEIGTHMAAYPTVDGPYGEVWLDVPGAPAEWIYNVPVTLAPVFPGEQVGLESDAEQLALARRSAQTVRLEGGNDLVYQPLIRARLGMLDAAWFKQEVRYSRLPNGIANDRVRQSGGRYGEMTDFDYMMRMGVWTENLSLPAVLNECLLQSYSGVMRLFPNTTNLGPARFRDLRAAGAFLVSAEWDGQAVAGVRILSEKGATLRLRNPWGEAAVRVTPETTVERQAGVLSIRTRAGGRYAIEKAG